MIYFKQMFDYLIAEKTPNFHICGNWEFFSSLVSGLNRRLIESFNVYQVSAKLKFVFQLEVNPFVLMVLEYLK